MTNRQYKLTTFTVALYLILALDGALTSAQTPDSRQLTTGQVIERELKGDEAHSYSLALTAGQYLNVAVEQKGIDVVVALFDANGKKVIEVDSPNGTQGEEPIALIIETAGNYRLEVRSLEKTAAAGRYEVKINELRTATENDKNFIATIAAANKAFTKARELHQQGTPKSLRNAIKKYEESLLFFRAIKYHQSEAETLNNIGVVYDILGEQQQALKFYNESLLLFRAIDNKGGEVSMLSKIGLFYFFLHDEQKALKYLKDSLLLSHEVGDKRDEAAILNNLGMVYFNLGEKQQSLKFYNESLLLFRAIGDKRGETATLAGIVGVYSRFGEKQQALKFYKERLLFSRANGDKRDEAKTLAFIGGVNSDLGEKQQALKFYNEALTLHRAVNDHNSESITLSNIGSVYFDLGEQQLALKYYNESLPVFRAVGDKQGEAMILDSLMNQVESDNSRFGIFYGKQSVNNFQILRSNVRGLDKSIQQGFLKSIERAYRRLADALIEQKRYAEAQQVLNSFKDQQFFDFSRSKQFAPLAVTAREAELTATFNQKLETVVAAIHALDEYKRGIGSRPPTAAETAQLKSLADKQIAANADYLAFLKTAEQQFAAPLDDKDKIPDVLDLTQLQTTLREVSAQTGEKSVAVYTLVGSDNYCALVVTPDSIFSVSTPIKGAMLNQKARQLWRLLRTPQFDPQPLAKEIYDVVFAPLAAKLPADTKTILWSLDGSLRYVPMAALHDGKQYLVERYNNVVFTRADTERLTRNVSANLTASGFGGSQRFTVKYGGGIFKARELPAVKTEMARIFKNNNSTTGILSGEVLLDRQFTRSAMISTLQKRRPLVHIASHFIFKPGDEANSFLLLGDGTAFTLDEMKRQKDLFAGVELLALSACDTAAQQEDSNGREVDGFAELAQRLGAGAVMASLWEVQDESTAELMTRFYKTYNSQKGANKATSLRSAQLALLSGKYKTAGAANRGMIREDAETAAKIKIESAKLKPFNYVKNPRFAHPYYWSPFILIGNWK